MDVDDPKTAGLDFFPTWKVDSLRTFLEKRGLFKEGTRAELAALCFAASKMEIPIVQSLDIARKQNEQDYAKTLLLDDGTCLPDPFQLNTGWCNEKDGISQWPPVYINDISLYFMRKNDPSSVKLLNEYKVGKAYSYFTSGWLKEVFYHHINTASPYCLLRAACTPSMKVADVDHSVWCCVRKADGCIMRVYCSCTAG